ncbi:MAG: succinate--CoA ligase subunit beta [Nitrososphaerales archaeon]
MRLLEYEAKSLFSEYGIPVPKSLVANNIERVKKAGEELGFPLVLKAQLKVGGRGKAGVIKICKKPEELKTLFDDLMSKTVHGEKVKTVLIEQFVEHTNELYLSIYLNRSKRCYSVIASAEGGVEIENVGNKVILDVGIEGPKEKDFEHVASKLSLSGVSAKSFIEFAAKLNNLVLKKEAELAEINPIAIRNDGTLLALDAKVIVDDNAMFRHEELNKYEDKSTLEAEAKKNGFSLVELDGNIAVIGNGAGLVMSTLDMLSDHGGKPACFLDVGGRATTESVLTALRLISRISKVESILVNLFGGIVRTSVVAQAIIDAYNSDIIHVPVFARISGAESDKAKEILNGSTAKMFGSVEEAIVSVVKSVKENG